MGKKREARRGPPGNNAAVKHATAKPAAVWWGLSLALLALGLAFCLDFLGPAASLAPIPLVDTNFVSTATVRMSAADLVRAGEDVSMLDCYACHEKNKPPKLKMDADGNVILPQAHEDIVMGHGRHNRNNNCYNCHDESNLELLQTRDGRHLKIVESPALCGSCHGPTYRDWEAGVHGRTSGYWKRDLGAIDRKVCTSCHNPHSPPFPSRPPAPGPHPLHPLAKLAAEKERHN